MNVFLNSNPGLRSRFGQYFHFEDYLPDELMRIGELTAKKKNVVLTEDAKVLLLKKLVEAYRGRDFSFGNARYVTSIIAEAKENMALRAMRSPNPESLSKEDLSTITKEDIAHTFEEENLRRLDLTIDDELLREAMEELNQLVGMQNLKQEISELVKLVKYYREIGRDVLNKFSLHSVFTGNPGTGKTTVARIMAKIYKALGFIERGHLVEVDRQSLVAGYVGQTAIKTKEMIDKAMGGVLFIDEAYALSKGGGNDFGHEVIETLLKVMEDKRGEFSVIVAGYTDDMEIFLESNPGLKSRFDSTFAFIDYTVDELLQIAEIMLAKENLALHPEAAEYLKTYLQFIYDSRDKYFGNAREVRRIVEKAVRQQHLRLASMERGQRTQEMIETLMPEDLKEFKLERADNKTRIGFR
jgi:SpoVK/Ycf46/Vps4 family AAA+-type ATPase